MSEPLRPVSGARPRGADAVRAIGRVTERPRHDGDDDARREPREDERREPPAPAGPDADGHVDLLA